MITKIVLLFHLKSPFRSQDIQFFIFLSPLFSLLVIDLEDDQR